MVIKIEYIYIYIYIYIKKQIKHMRINYLKIKSYCNCKQ